MRNVLRHARLQRVLRVIFEPKQRRALVPQFQNAQNERRIVPAARVRSLIARARDVRLVHPPAQFAIVGVRHERDIKRSFEAEFVALLSFTLRRLLGHRQRGRRQTA